MLTVNERSRILIYIRSIIKIYLFNKTMSQKQYVKMIEKEIHNLNKKIDLKIMHGEDYKREARDHKIMIRRMRYLTRKNSFKGFLDKFFPSFSLPF